MKTTTTKRAILLRSILILPLIAFVLFSFSTKEIIYQEKATKLMILEYNKLATKYNNQDKNNRVIFLKEVERLQYIYKLMTPSQKESAEPFPNFPPPPPKINEVDTVPPVPNKPEQKEIK